MQKDLKQRTIYMIYMMYKTQKKTKRHELYFADKLNNRTVGHMCYYFLSVHAEKVKSLKQTEHR